MEAGYIVKDGKRLRLGYTTGTCAAAAAQAAAQFLLTGQAPQAVKLVTPAGIALTLPVASASREGRTAICSIIKDGGDDVDETHGMKVFAKVSLIAQGLELEAGEGVGRVTKPGLAIPPGNPAINPVPRQMLKQALEITAQAAGYQGGFSVVLSIPGGAAAAQRTFNPALGIEGGLSILGTSGLVEPMSERALVETIKAELDFRRSAGERLLLLTPGNYGQDFATKAYGLTLPDGVKCSNFIGEALDYAAFKGFSHVLLIGHAGKLVKLAAGIFHTHSSVADGRREVFAAHAALCGASRQTVARLMRAPTVDAMLVILEEAGALRETVDSIGEEIGQQLEARLRRRGGGLKAEFILFTNQWGELLHSPGAKKLAEQIKEKDR